jgi:type I restriction enzyme S subunit
MNVPALRFKEFSGDWEKKTLGDVAEINPKTDFLPEEFIYIDLESVEKGILLKETRIRRDVAPSRAQRFLKKEDILFQMVRPYQGNNLFFDIIGDYVASTGYAQIRTMENPRFLYQSLHLENFTADVMNRCTGTSYPAINSSGLALILITIPSLPEQTKIANFLTAVDNKITLLTKKADLLSQYKKGVMQQIFSQELRFKDDDGQEFPEWEGRQADEVFMSVSNKNHNGDLPILAATQDKGMIYREDSGLDIKSSEASIKSYKIVEKGDFVISLRSFQGGIEYSSLMGICSPAYTVMKAKIELNNGFFKAFLKKEDFIEKLNGLVIGIRDGKQISYSAFATLTLPYPNIKEQTKIANFLTAIDEKITNNQTQLDAVKQYKQGLLQQMFV